MNLTSARMWLTATAIALTGLAEAQTTTKAIGPNADITVSGRVDYVALGASFRVTNGNTNSCQVKSNSPGNTAGIITGNTGTQAEVNGIDATVTAAQRTAAQQVPAGATVRAAYLYWFASKATNTAVDNTVTFTVGGTPQVVTAARTWTGNFDVSDMGAVADVTSLVRANPNATMRMDNLNIQVNSLNCSYSTVHGGWALYIVYENEGLSTKKISFYDGLNYIYGTTTADINVTGLTVPNAPAYDKVTKLTVVAAEGDPGSNGSDVLQIRAGTTGTRTSLSSASRPATDIYRGIVTYEDENGNESIQGGSSVTGTTTTGGVDVATFNVSNILPAGTNSINAYSASNSGEQVNLYSMVVMANVNDANVRLVKALEGATTVSTGDTVKYLLTVDNRQGVTEALNVVTVDSLPKGLTYTGTEISYDGGTTWTTLTGVTTTVNATTGITTITLPAIRRLDNDGRAWGGTNAIATLLGTQDVRYRITTTVNGQVFGAVTNTATATSGITESVTNQADNTGTQPLTINRRADLAIDKNAVVAVGAGRPLTYTVRVWNNGPDSTSSVTLTDALPAGFTGATVACAATGSATCGTSSVSGSTVTMTTGTLSVDTTPGNSVPDGNYLTYTITGTAPDASGILQNQAALTVPTGVSDPVSGNNTSARVDTHLINAVTDPAVSVPGPSGGAVSVLGNDTNGSNTATATNSTVTINNAGGLSGLTVNGAGQLVIPAGAAAGAYTVTYQLCDKTVTGACDTATIPITVTAATPNLSLAISGPAFARPSTVANTNPPVTAVDQFVSYTLTVSTATANATGTTTVTTTLPGGLGWTGTYTSSTGAWMCTASAQTVTCTTTGTITTATPQTITLTNLRVSPGTAAAPTFTTTSQVSNPAETTADASSGNTASVTTRLILNTLTKSVRNVTADLRDNGGTPRFSTTSTGLPAEVLEYCITVQNPGGADLANYILTDVLNGLGVPLTSVGTDAAYAGQAIKWTRTTPSVGTTTGRYTAAVGDDAGTLDSSLRVTLGTLLAGETVTVCFQVQIR